MKTFLLQALLFAVLLAAPMTIAAQCNNCATTVSGNFPINNGGTITWPLSSCIDQNVVIDNNTTVIISNKNIKFKDDIGITVKVGSQLIIENSTLEGCVPSSPYGIGLWAGIYVEGSDGEQRSDPGNYSLTNYSLFYMGYAVMGLVEANESTFKDMKKGIQSTGGGIIVLEGCSLVDNKVSIDAKNYNYTGPEEDVAFKVSECVFEHTSNSRVNRPLFINLYEIPAFEIAGCEFINNDPNHINSIQRGTAINSEYSNYVVHKSGFNIYKFNDYPNNQDGQDEYGCPLYAAPAKSCSFKNLTYGINNYYGSVHVAYSEFLNNYQDIYLYLGQHHHIGRDNHFEIVESTYDDLFDEQDPNWIKNFLYIGGGKNWIVAENTFVSDYTGEIWFTWFEGSGLSGASVYKNTLTSTVVGPSHGHLIHGENRWLYIRCNIYVGLYHDWYLTQNAVIAYEQGHPYTNTFSQGAVYNIYRELTTWPEYYYEICTSHVDYIPANKPSTQNHNGIYVIESGGACSTGVKECSDLNCKDDPTSVAEVKSNNNINIYPNPAKDVFYISPKENSAPIIGVKVYTLKGQILFKENYTNHLDVVMIKASDLNIKTGFVIVEVIQKGYIYTQEKILIE